MKNEPKKMNTIVKTDMEITLEFKKQAKLKGESFPEALECAMRLYNKKAKEVQK